jgi:uncharacterized protein (TIGR03067 family)
MKGKHLLCTVTALLALAGLWAAPPPQRTDQEKLWGAWRFVSFEVNGEKTPSEKLRDAEFVFEKDLFSATDGKTRRKGSFRLAAGMNPACIDLTASDEDDGATQLGIYKFESGFLLICLSEGKDRPRAFEAKRGTANNILLKLAPKKAE